MEEKTKAIELLIGENEELKAQLEEMTLRAKDAEAENKMLIDHWMLHEMQEAERLNEVCSEGNPESMAILILPII